MENKEEFRGGTREDTVLDETFMNFDHYNELSYREKAFYDLLLRLDERLKKTNELLESLVHLDET